MTATVEETTTDLATGRVARVIGPVLDIEFPADQMPDIYNALLVDTEVAGTAEYEALLDLTLEAMLGMAMSRVVDREPDHYDRVLARLTDLAREALAHDPGGMS